MNTQASRLPELNDARVDEIEDALFAEIAADRRTEHARRSRRGRIWMAGGAAAAVIAVAAIIAPSVGSLVGGGAGGGSSVSSVDEAAVAPADGRVDPAPQAESGAESGAFDVATTDATAMDDGAADRDIMTTATATVVVDDVARASTAIGNAATAAGGYVQSSSIGTTGGLPVDPSSGLAVDSAPYPYNPDGAWVSVRVPAAELPDLVAGLSDLGEVTASSVDRQDVTAQTVDLEARVSAAQASVDRLTALMAQAGNLGDLIAAEAALSERQAMLESYQQQLEMMADQVEMSTITVTLAPEAATVEADPAGFTDGVAAGWNGLVASLNGIVIAFGFLLPWLVVIAVVALIVWAIRRAVVGRRRRRAVAETAVSETSAE